MADCTKCESLKYSKEHHDKDYTPAMNHSLPSKHRHIKQFPDKTGYQQSRDALHIAQQDWPSTVGGSNCWNSNTIHRTLRCEGDTKLPFVANGTSHTEGVCSKKIKQSRYRPGVAQSVPGS